VIRCVRGSGRLAFAAFAGLLLGSCAPASAPMEYYVLSPTTPIAAAPSAANREFTLGVGPIRLPEYLDRPQIVTRRSPHELQLASGHRWAESLQENISGVLAENLSLLLAPGRVLNYPWGPSARVDYQVAAEFARFEATPDHAVRLVARWTLTPRSTTAPVIAHRSDLSVPISGAGYGAIVAAQSEALAQLSRQIAAALECDVEPASCGHSMPAAH
jgi:uncharacterized protein